MDINNYEKQHAFISTGRLVGDHRNIIYLLNILFSTMG